MGLERKSAKSEERRSASSFGVLPALAVEAMIGVSVVGLDRESVVVLRSLKVCDMINQC